MSKQLVEAMGRAYKEIQEAAQKQKENNYIYAAKMAKAKGDKTFTIGGKDYDVDEALHKEDNTNDKSDDGDGMDKVQPKAVKKKFDDRKDKDIDNDGDTDSSDEYLHKRRKAISKNIKEDDVDVDSSESEEDPEKEAPKKKKKKGDDEAEVEMSPKAEGTINEKTTKVDMIKGKDGTAVQIVKDEKGRHVALFSGKGSTQIPLKKYDKKIVQKALDHFAKNNGMIGNSLAKIEEGKSIRQRLTAFLEADQNPNKAKAEKPEDKLSGKGAKDMMDQPIEKDDTVEKGHDDASKAGKVTKPAPKNATKGVAEAYASMYNKGE